MKIIRLLVMFLLIMGFSSCDDFLEEEFLTGVSKEAHYTDPAGMETLINACYVTSKIWFGQEYGWDFSTVGTDIYDYGQQHPQIYQYTFSRDFNSTNSRLVVLWVELYKGVNACNNAIYYLTNESPFDEDHTQKRLSEVRYLRALYNWLLVETWGGVQLREEPVVGAVKTAERSSIQDFYDLIFRDLDYAVENLDESVNTGSSDFGRVTHMAARGFRARMALTYAGYDGYQEKEFGEISVDQNAYYRMAAEDAEYVINNGGFELYDNYEDMWALENNKNNNAESIWAVNFSLTQYSQMNVPTEEYVDYQREGDKPWGDREGGHHGHLMFGSQYDVSVLGMTRDMENGRPFRRYFPTKYLIDCYKGQEDVDERFETTFKQTWFSNDPTEIEHDDEIIYDGMEEGDTAIHYTIYEIPDDQQLKIGNYYWHTENNYWCLDYANMYNDDGTINGDETNNRNNFLELHKFYDNERQVADGDGSERGQRDAIVMRISEMYLIAAEARMELGENGTAYNHLETLADARSYDGDGAAMLAEYGVNGGGDIDLNFILDERARELVGEQLRWFDLKRTGTLVERMRQYAGNHRARQNFNEDFTLRPIPQVQRDALEDKSNFWQNPGY